MANINDILNDARIKGCSDVHIGENTGITLRQDGKLIGFEQAFSNEEIKEMILSMCKDRILKIVEKHEDADFVYVNDLGRHRVNIYFQQGYMTAAIRIINEQIKTLEELNLPDVLHKLALLPRGLVLVTGPTGSGKSTILELLLRFYEPEEGEILCNGENIKVLKLSEYRSLFSVVSQKSALFLGDIVQNIDLEGKADRQKLNEVLRKSGVKKYLQRFPEKEKTQIGDDGAFLSGGERQKLVVARALLKDAPVMLFDEASSGFDVEANEYLYKIITEEMPEKSVIFITHHYDKLEKCRGD